MESIKSSLKTFDNLYSELNFEQQRSAFRGMMVLIFQFSLVVLLIFSFISNIRKPEMKNLSEENYFDIKYLNLTEQSFNLKLNLTFTTFYMSEKIEENSSCIPWLTVGNIRYSFSNYTKKKVFLNVETNFNFDVNTEFKNENGKLYNKNKIGIDIVCENIQNDEYNKDFSQLKKLLEYKLGYTDLSMKYINKIYLSNLDNYKSQHINYITQNYKNPNLNFNIINVNFIPNLNVVADNPADLFGNKQLDFEKFNYFEPNQPIEENFLITPKHINIELNQVQFNNEGDSISNTKFYQTEKKIVVKNFVSINFNDIFDFKCSIKEYQEPHYYFPTILSVYQIVMVAFEFLNSKFISYSKYFKFFNRVSTIAIKNNIVNERQLTMKLNSIIEQSNKFSLQENYNNNFEGINKRYYFEKSDGVLFFLCCLPKLKKTKKKIFYVLHDYYKKIFSQFTCQETIYLTVRNLIGENIIDLNQSVGDLFMLNEKFEIEKHSVIKNVSILQKEVKIINDSNFNSLLKGKYQFKIN